MFARIALIVSAAAISSQLAGCASLCCPQGGCGDVCGCAAPSGCGDECGCGVPCCPHPSMAGQTWSCCDGEGPKLCYCTGPGGECYHRGCCGWISRWWHGDPCGCGNCCDEPACGCEATCGCEPGCDAGCSSACGGCAPVKGPCYALWNALCGCSGCDSELYWSEWHNDPPRCCDPCDQCGNWIGPGAGSYQAPYSHSYAVARQPQGTHTASKQPTGVTRPESAKGVVK